MKNHQTINEALLAPEPPRLYRSIIKASVAKWRRSQVLYD